MGLDPSTVERVPIKDRAGITGQVFSSGKTLAAQTFGAAQRAEQSYSRDAFVSAPLVSLDLSDPASWSADM